MSELGIYGARKAEEVSAARLRKKGVHSCPMFVCSCKTDEECGRRRCWCCRH